jgi:alpha-galactosidase
MRESLNVVLVGAASPQWGHNISRDLLVSLSSDRICASYDPVLVLEDLDPRTLEPQAALARKVAEKLGNKVRIESTTDQRKALEGARFVVVSFAVGTLEAMQSDIEIPMEYGIFQPVGDTISIGGAIRAARNIPAILSVARDLEAVGHPEAWLFNLANPMSTLCRAVTRETRVRTIGCCHELYGGIRFLSDKIGFRNEEWRKRLKLEVVGINHCGWMRTVTLDGEDGLALFRKYLREQGLTQETSRLYNSEIPHLTRNNVKINLFLRHGVLPYSGDRHNAEFFTEFCNRQTNRGADYGVLLTTPQERLVQWRGEARATVNALLAGRKEMDLNLSQEAAGRLILSLLFKEAFYDVGNLPYRGRSLPGLPQGAVIERMVTYGPDGAVPDEVSPLPAPVHEHMVQVARNIEDVVEASLTGNRRRLLRAMRNDPLLKNMNPRKIPELVGRLLEVHRAHVHPGFF